MLNLCTLSLFAQFSYNVLFRHAIRVRGSIYFHELFLNGAYVLSMRVQCINWNRKRTNIYNRRNLSFINRIDEGSPAFIVLLLLKYMLVYYTTSPIIHDVVALQL